MIGVDPKSILSFPSKTKYSALSNTEPIIVPEKELLERFLTVVGAVMALQYVLMDLPGLDPLTT